MAAVGMGTQCLGTGDTRQALHSSIIPCIRFPSSLQISACLFTTDFLFLAFQFSFVGSFWFLRSHSIARGSLELMTILLYLLSDGDTAMSHHTHTMDYIFFLF